MDLIIHTSSLLPPVAGIGRYTEQLIKCLLQDGRINDIQAFDQLKTYHRDELQAKMLSKEHTQESGGKYALLRKYFRQIPGGYFVRQQIKQQISKRALRNSQGYIYWEPNYIVQEFAGPSVATIHDLSHLRYPEHHSIAMLKWLEKELPASIEKASALVTVSEFSRHEISQLFGVDKNHITVVPPAVAPEFRIRYSAAELQRVRECYQLPEKFILTVGTLEPRKNVLGLMRAYCLLPAELRMRFPLIVVGASGWNKRIDEKMIQGLVNKGDIKLKGFVAQHDLPALYQAATLFAYVSFYEGYGMPIAEAMASGVAVITSERASMPEVADGCAELVNPDDINNMSQALQKCLEDESYRQRKIMLGIEKSESYTWERSKNKLVGLFMMIQK